MSSKIETSAITGSTILLLAFIITVGVTSVNGQAFGGDAIEIPDSYSFVRVGEPSMEIVVMGSVQRPGSYRIREGTDLSTVFMYAGGASTIGERRKRKRPEVTLQISRRMDGGGRDIVFETDFESMINREVEYPILQRDDIIVVETVPLRPRFQWRDAASLISVASTTLLIVDRFIMPLSDR
ncbi:MAG: hypothetical protein WD267_14110 [Balneolales bacterium]